MTRRAKQQRKSAHKRRTRSVQADIDRVVAVRVEHAAAMRDGYSCTCDACRRMTVMEERRT